MTYPELAGAVRAAIDLDGEHTDLSPLLPFLTEQAASPHIYEIAQLLDSIREHEANGSSACHGRCIDAHTHYTGNPDWERCIADARLVIASRVDELIQANSRARDARSLIRSIAGLAVTA